jgi:hypothetical protein
MNCGGWISVPSQPVNPRRHTTSANVNLRANQRTQSRMSIGLDLMPYSIDTPADISRSALGSAGEQVRNRRLCQDFRVFSGASFLNRRSRRLDALNHPRRSVQGAESFDMWTTKHIAARMLIWLAAIAILGQGLPAASCACSAGQVGCRQQNLRSGGCTAKSSGGCCSSAHREAAVAGNCCCERGGNKGKQSCKCGVSCQCGKARQSEPAAPPVEDNRPAEKVVSHAALAGLIVPVVHAPVLTLGQRDASLHLSAATALDRCVSLCRLTV